ncbi:uncharacterized protein BT62DRAFT_1055719, partial [Guyanagaster necrorhizus]
LYHTGKEWSPPSGPEAQHHLKELCEVFDHPITPIPFTMVDVIHFKMVKVNNASEDKEDTDKEMVEANKLVVSPVTIWIRVFSESTSAMAAHNIAQDILALLKDYQITNINVDFHKSFYMCKADPQLLKPISVKNPLIDIVSLLTPTLGLHISTEARPNTQGTIALYLARGGGSEKLLGLSCHHIFIRSKEANNDYVYHSSAPCKNVLLLSNRDITDLVNSIKINIRGYSTVVKNYRKDIKGFEEREKGTNATDVREAKVAQIKIQVLLDSVEKKIDALTVLCNQLNNNWNRLQNCVLGHILCFPPISVSVSEQHLMEDWGVFKINQAKLSDGFQGNKIDLRTKLTPDQFKEKCFIPGDTNWEFTYPKDHLLPLMGIIPDNILCTSNMWDLDGEPCLLVIKNGNATSTTIGHANDVFSIVCKYFTDMSIDQTSMEWVIINYDSKSEVFLEPGNSGSVIADIHGHISEMLTGGSGRMLSSDMIYATLFWWLLEHIKLNRFSNMHLSIVTYASQHP